MLTRFSSRASRFFRASLACGILVLPAKAFGALAFGEVPESTVFADSDFSFVKPNEWHPEDALEVFQRAPAGAYVAVGADRGFLGAANTPRATHLILVDTSPEVVLFNQMNVALLKIARDREHYLQLRLQPTAGLWEQAAREAALDEPSRDLLLRHLGTWKEQVANKRRLGFAELYSPGGEFKGVNYLHNDSLFARIRAMAREGRIFVAAGDLGDADTQAKLAALMEKQRVKLSVLDFSNAWLQRYTKRASLVELLRRLRAAATENSLFLVSRKIELGLKQLTRPRKANELLWNYRAFTFGFMDAEGSPEGFYDRFIGKMEGPQLLASRIFGRGLSPVHGPLSCGERFAEIPAVNDGAR